MGLHLAYESDDEPGELVKPQSYDFERLSGLAPNLPPSAGLIVFDNVCVLCSGFVQWVLARDHKGLFWFTAAQGQVGQAIYADLHMDLVNFETNLVVIDGMVYGKLGAFVQVASRLGGIWRASLIFSVLPWRVQNWLYDLVAANRYRLFGKRESCWLPRPGYLDRVI